MGKQYHQKLTALMQSVSGNVAESVHTHLTLNDGKALLLVSDKGKVLIFTEKKILLLSIVSFVTPSHTFLSHFPAQRPVFSLPPLYVLDPVAIS